MDNIDVYTINGKDYAIADIIEINDKTYAYMTNVDSENDLCIQRIETENGHKYFVGLTDQEEFNKALEEFYKKYKDLVS